MILSSSVQQLANVKIAIVAAEIGPYAKAGGLADVIGALPRTLKNLGADPMIIVPGYKVLLEKLATEPFGENQAISLGSSRERFGILRAEGTGGVPLYLIDHPGFFAREGIYGDENGDYPDNFQRFIFFGRAAAATAAMLHPDILHAHDWHAAVVPIVVRADAALRQRFAATSSFFTIHNLAFQGVCERDLFPLLGIDESWFSIEGLEFYGRVNLMKGAVVFADAASTVSPTYAFEVTNDPAQGFGLDGVLRAKGDRFIGILNGADYDEWNPATDPLISKRFSPGRRTGKKACLYDLREEMKLPHRQSTPIVAMITRMTTQKGVDLVAAALDRLVELEVQIVMLASGDPQLEQFFKTAENRYPDYLRVNLRFDNGLAHRIQAGSDMFMMPSRFEPCGLAEMYALKYGNALIVRATGGLRDTVAEFDPKSGRGNGFVFDQFQPEELVAATARAVNIFRKPPLWRRLMGNCFEADFSWTGAAREYLDWFSRIHSQREPA
jgi:starch synthase